LNLHKKKKAFTQSRKGTKDRKEKIKQFKENHSMHKRAQGIIQ